MDAVIAIRLLPSFTSPWQLVYPVLERREMLTGIILFCACAVFLLYLAAKK